jgi:hypothetical protein
MGEGFCSDEAIVIPLRCRGSTIVRLDAPTSLMQGPLQQPVRLLGRGKEAARDSAIDRPKCRWDGGDNPKEMGRGDVVDSWGWEEGPVAAQRDRQIPPPLQLWAHYHQKLAIRTLGLVFLKPVRERERAVWWKELRWRHRGSRLWLRSAGRICLRSYAVALIGVLH